MQRLRLSRFTHLGKPETLSLLADTSRSAPSLDGKREQLEGKIQERYGLDKDAARKHVDDWINKQ